MEKTYLKNSKRCFIFAAADFYGLYEKPACGDIVIAADAGYLLCKSLGITPGLLIGDFDSMDMPLDFDNTVRVPVEKDDTDTMLAIRKGIEYGCNEIYIYGGTGGKRLDHSLANMQSIAFARRHGVRAYLYDKEFIYTVIENEELFIKKTVEFGLVSVFAMDSAADGVTLKGLHYPLMNGSLYPDMPLGVSNHIEADTACVSCKKGLLLVGWQLPPV